MSAVQTLTTTTYNRHRLQESAVKTKNNLPNNNSNDENNNNTGEYYERSKSVDQKPNEIANLTGQKDRKEKKGNREISASQAKEKTGWENNSQPAAENKEERRKTIDLISLIRFVTV